MEAVAKTVEVDPKLGEAWRDFNNLLEGRMSLRTDFLTESSELSDMSLDKFVEMDPEQLVAMLDDSHNEAVVVERLKLLGYWVAYKVIRQREGAFQLRGDAGEKFVEIQRQIDEVALVWLNHEISTNSEAGNTADWAQEQLKILIYDLERRDKKYTNLQILRGSRCNVGCVFCFTQKAELDETNTQSHLVEMSEVNYDKGELALQMLYARMAHRLDEVLFTSFGDPLANERSEPDESRPGKLVGLNEEIKIAKEVGFPQITLLTNGSGLMDTDTSRLSADERKRLGVDLDARELSLEEIDRLGKIRIDMLVESGLTHLTISLHTMNPEVWRRLVNPRTGITYEQMVEWVRYAGSKKGLTARINVAYGTEVEDARELIPWARDTLGVQELTLVEMIPGNTYAIEHKRQPPDDSEMKRMGFEVVGGHPWGMRIYQRPGEEFSVAVCHFGQQDASFADQDKNLELLLTGGKGKKGSMLVAGGLWDKRALEWWKI